MNPYSTQSIDQDDIEAVARVLNSKHLTQGSVNIEFEEKIASYVGAKYALTFNSATSALYCAYKALELENSDVLTTPISFVATSNMLLAVGADPVFCDVYTNGNINPNKLIPTKNTKAIVSVDYGGNSVEADTIAKIAKENSLKFISDSSHSFGGEYKGKKIGSLADVSIFSFHALKPITTGEGGALLTDDEEIYERAKLIRSHGVVKKKLYSSDVIECGFNFRLSDICASLGISQLKTPPDGSLQQVQPV